MGLLKKSGGSLVLLGLGALMALTGLLEFWVNFAASGGIYKGDIPKALMQLSVAGVLVAFGYVLNGYYAKSRKFPAYVKGLKLAVALFCVSWAPYTANIIYYDIAMRKYVSLFTMPFQIAMDLLLPLAVVAGCLFVFDMSGEVAKSWEVK